MSYQKTAWTAGPGMPRGPKGQMDQLHFLWEEYILVQVSSQALAGFYIFDGVLISQDQRGFP